MYKISIRDVEHVERCNILLIRNEDGVFDTIVRPVNPIESVDTEDLGIRVCTFSSFTSLLRFQSQTPTTNRYAHASSEKMVLSGDHFSVGDTIGSEQRAKLQNCFAQFQQYGALLKPLMSGMNDMSDRLNPKPTASKTYVASEEKRDTTNNEEEEKKNVNGGDTRRRHSKTRKNRIKFEDEKIKLERGRRRHQRGRYKPTTKLWDMLDQLEEVKSKARK